MALKQTFLTAGMIFFFFFCIHLVDSGIYPMHVKLEQVFVKHNAPNICFRKYGQICTVP